MEGCWTEVSWQRQTNISLAQVATRKRGSVPTVLQASGCLPPGNMAVPPSTAPQGERVVHSHVGSMTPKLNRPQVQANNHFLDQTAIPLPENAALGHCPCPPTLSLLSCVSVLHGDPELVPLRSSEQGAMKIRKVWIQILLHQPCDLGHVTSFLCMSVFLSVR